MLKKVRDYYHSHPLRSILFAGFIIRLVSVVFSQGYGFSDDHFFVIEVAQQWVDGIDTKGWMPWNGNTSPNGPSLFYPGLHYLLFLFLKHLGITDPVFKMYLVRLIHALYSLLIIYLGFLIAKKKGGYPLAKQIGWMLALLWFMPIMSVRNAVEMVCIPPLLYAAWLFIRAEELPVSVNEHSWTGGQKMSLCLTAGIFAGIAFSIRFQSLIFIGGFGLVLLLKRHFMDTVIFGIGALMSIIVLQGGIDWFIWGRPFAEFMVYVQFNIDNASNYITGPWYNYLLLLCGTLIPPISLYILFGLFKSWKKYAILLMPALLFFLFHSYFPNKQERFILPVIPFFLIAGLGGWNEFLENSKFWTRHRNLYKKSWRWFWIINTILLLVFTPGSTKISRVNAMTWIHHQKDYHYFAFETTQMWGTQSMPLFYAGKWNPYYEITQERGARDVFASIRSTQSPLPEYIIFAEEKDLDKRIALVRKEVKNLKFEAQIETGYLDKLMTFLNPVNTNQTYYIYRAEYGN